MARPNTNLRHAFPSFFFLAVSVFLVFMAASPLFGQGGVTGAISGHVTDPSGASVPRAAVTVTNINTGVSYHASTTSDGYYTVQSLISGTYTVTVTHSGFTKAVVDNVLVQAASNPSVNVKLKMGAVAQTVTVRATGSLLEAQRADTGSNVDTVRVNNTPTQQRNVIGLAYTSPGVLPTSAMKSYTPFDNSGSSSMSINGSQSGNNSQGATNAMVVDGVPNRMSYISHIFGYIPTQETTNEMKVITNPYSAEYGNTLGGVIAVETKSGTNKFHGQLFEYNRTTALAANTFDRNLAGKPKLPTNFNTPGGQIGGPIKRNKAFFFFSYESIIDRTPKAYTGTVPTLAQRNGDFSQTYYNNNGTAALQTIYNPFTVAYDPQTGQYTRTAFSGNVIPTNLMTPVAAPFWALIPMSNATGAPITQANNYFPTANSSAVGKLHEYTSRVDYNINDTNRISVRYIHENFSAYDVKFYDNAANPNSGSPFVRANENAFISYTHTLSPTSVLDVELGMERYFTENIQYQRCGVGPSQLGFSQTFVSQAASCFPVFSFGGSTLGGPQFTGAGTGGGSQQPDQMNTLSAVLTKLLGRQTIKVGWQGLLERYYQLAPGNDAGAFGFSPTYTNYNPQINTPSSGNAVAAFDLGVGSASIDLNSEPARQNKSMDTYIQDDIRLTPKLTINAGLRWDWYGPMTDRFNAMTGAFETTVASPLATQVANAPGASNCPACGNLVGGLTFPGVGGASRSPYNTSYTDFGPRLGAAYMLNNRTVIRAGWGLFYQGAVYDPGSAGFSQTTNSVAFAPDYMPENLINNPFPTGLMISTGSSLGLMTDVGAGVSFVDPQARMPRSQQFSFNIQRELTPSMVLTVGYTYNGISRVPVSRNLNFLTASEMAQGSSYLNQVVTNPFAGLVPGYALNQSTISLSHLLLAYPQFTSVTENDIPIGNSAYHALVVQLTKHFSRGLSLSVAYTKSRHMGRYFYQNAFDTTLEKTLDPFDIPQTFFLNGVWEFPIGRGQPFAAKLPGWLNQAVGGWQFNWLVRVESGTPWRFATDTIPVSGVNPNAPNQNINQWANPAAFQLKTNPYAPVTWNVIDGRVRVPYIHDFNLGLFKSFNITENVKFTFMTNWINAFNTPQFWNPPGSCTSISSLCFGKIAGYQTQTNLPRNIQLAGRITF